MFRWIAPFDMVLELFVVVSSMISKTEPGMDVRMMFSSMYSLFSESVIVRLYVPSDRSGIVKLFSLDIPAFDCPVVIFCQVYW